MKCVFYMLIGSDAVMKHGFEGSLAGLSILVGLHESTAVLSCLTRCQEALDTPAMELLQPSMELLTDNGNIFTFFIYKKIKVCYRIGNLFLFYQFHPSVSCNILSLI